MKTLWGSIGSFYDGWLHPTFVSFITFLVNNQFAIYVLIAILIVLAIVKKIIVKKKLKIQIWLKAINFFNFVIIVLLIIVAYDSFTPAISKYYKQIMANTPTPSTTNQTTNGNQSTPGTQSTPTQQSTPSTQTTKQLYYAVSCSTCWNTGCVHNGYSYGGYDASYYAYIKGICQSCSCNDYKAQSFWR